MNTLEKPHPENNKQRFVEAYQRADRLMGMLPENREKQFDPIWRDFFALTAIPRASGKEQLVGEFLEYVGQERGAVVEKDVVGNVLWRIPASSPELAVPEKSVFTQVHQDQVSKGNPDPAIYGVEPEAVERDGSWFVQSKGNQTTLGADDGIMVAVAMQLPFLLEGKSHGEIGVGFTVDEEQGLKGAKELGFNLNNYGNYLNLDSEEDHEITIGSAAVGDTFIELPIKRLPLTPNSTVITLHAEKFKGGHSGVKISDATRKNAIKMLTGIMQKANQEGANLTLASAEADGPMNAIPDAADFIVVGTAEDQQILERVMTEQQQALANTESPSARISLASGQANSALDKASTHTLLELLNQLPHGVLEREDYDDSLVKTSTNLARIQITPDETTVHIGMMSRSSDNKALAQLRKESIEQTATKHNATVTHVEASPAWEPVKDGDLAVLISDTHKELFGTPMRQVTTHGGLETSYIIVKYPQFRGHIASIGANVNNAHELAENTEGPSVERTTKLVIKILEKLAERNETHVRRSSTE